VTSNETTRPEAPAGAQPGREPISIRSIAAAIVIVLFVASIVLAQAWAVALERKRAPSIAADLDYQRDIGVAIARATLSQPGILPVYGSSELELDLPNLASRFFRDAPDGFTVCPIGRRGASPLILLEKAAAVCRPPACGKAVMLISQVWFLSRGETLANYAGNFSALQGLEVIFKAPLSPGLRRDIAQRMLAYAPTLSSTPILEQGVRAAAASDTVAGRMRYALLKPLGLMQTKVMELQDHFESVRDLKAAQRVPVVLPSGSPLDWDRLMAAAEAQSPIYDEATAPDRGPKLTADIWRGVGQMPDCTEWGDLELLLRAFQEMHVQVLLLDIPWSAVRYDASGVNAGIRDMYYSRLRSLAEKYRDPIATFQDHEYDARFLHDPHSHLSAKGWIFFDRDIDAFWRDLPLPLR